MVKKVLTVAGCAALLTYLTGHIDGALLKGSSWEGGATFGFPFFFESSSCGGFLYDPESCGDTFDFGFLMLDFVIWLAVSAAALYLGSKLWTRWRHE